MNRLSSRLASKVASLSLSQRFLLVSFPILLLTTLAVGWGVGRQVEDSVVRRIGGDTALYVDAFLARHLGSLERTGQLDEADRVALDALVDDAEWARRIVSLRIWRPDGLVLFSSDGEGVGGRPEIDEGLRAAAAGAIHTDMSIRRGASRLDHGQPLERVIETYTPIHTGARGHIGAVAEFYQLPDEADREAALAQWRSWSLVAAAMLMTYLLLFLVVRRGSQTIVAQRNELRDKLAQLTELHAQNDVLNARVRHAAAEAISVNEALLQRVSADVHDGPSQDLGFALMQIKNLRDGQQGDAPVPVRAGDLDRVSDAVQSAMRDLRAISADLELPQLEPLGLDEVAARVVRDFEARTQDAVQVMLACAVEPRMRWPYRIKATLYRLLQESLANVFRHARGSTCRVDLLADAARVRLVVIDNGPGFDVAAAQARRRLGLSGMRQRVEAQGGSFELSSTPGLGTTLRVELPTARAEETGGAPPVEGPSVGSGRDER